ncbi:MYND-type domain-containing protein [Mycena sanguinolenta]|uniref:MYND-type domain-containing protein n=1 Tax=Mycena sanguinolenta TaxID=230812 RepID=A0A8H6ZIU0_9AGAR|nr:MYND-type domain-containing protein [Mycena sanguinolenta]
MSPSQASKEAIANSMRYHEFLEKGLIPPKELGVPVKQLFPQDWNSHFEKGLLEKYGPNSNILRWKLENVDLQEVLSYLDRLHATNMEIAMTSKMLLDRQGMLVGLAIEQLRYNDFEAKWAAMDMEAKQGIVLDGLIRGAFKAREQSRFDCPEICVSGLAGDGQYSLVNLLRAIVAHDPSATFRLKSLFWYSHPKVEEEYAFITCPIAPDEARALGYLRMLERNHFIVQALLGILEAYSGKPAPKISVEEDIQNKQRQPCCCACGERTSAVTTLKRCSGCKIVCYCSKECQSRDWPVHKKLCSGRNARFDPAVVAATPDALEPAEFVGCPPPEPGFVRSPALWRQIFYLAKKDSYDRDYHFETSPDFTYSVRISDPTLRLIFFIARRRAMASGDRGAVGKLNDILQGLRRRGQVKFTERQICDQLEREYRVALSPPPEVWGADPTPQEIMEEMGYLERRKVLAAQQAAAEEEWKRE